MFYAVWFDRTPQVINVCVNSIHCSQRGLLSQDIVTVSGVSFVVLKKKKKKKKTLLETSFVDTSFVLLFAILAGQMEHFLFLISGKILSPEISSVCSFPGQLLKPQCLTLKEVQS